MARRESMRNVPPRERMYRLKFEKIVQNSFEVLKICCMGVCGPVILVESIVTVAYYKDIVNGCQKIPDNLTNVMIYILLISACMSLSVTAYCCFASFQVGKLLKELWPEIRHRENIRIQNQDEEDAESILSSQSRESRQGSVYS